MNLISLISEQTYCKLFTQMFFKCASMPNNFMISSFNIVQLKVDILFVYILRHGSFYVSKIVSRKTGDIKGCKKSVE